MLCALCSILVQNDTTKDCICLHHSTYSALRASTEDGCYLCSFLQQALLLQYSHDLCWTVDQAEEYHLGVDFVDSHKEERDRSTFIAEHSLYELDPAFSPYKKGSRGFDFVRSGSGEDAGPLRDVFPFVSFEVPFGSKAHLVGRIVGAPLTLEAPISLGRQWIQDCQDNHRFCRSGKQTPLPTRVLDVGPPEGSENIKLKVTDGLVGEYVTLSHRWGGSKPLTLREDTFPKLLSGIPLTSLPKTFQDAVVATRHLRFQYLWIDSLCIYQDSEKDWEKECTKMPSVYKNGQVNIASPSATDCDSGFLHQREALPIKELSIDWRILQGQSPENVRLVYRGMKDSYFPEPEPGSVLRGRAWIVQERLLARRVLYLESRKMYWECCSVTLYETSHFAFAKSVGTQDEVEKFSFETPQDRKYWLRTWYDIVATYSQTNMTKLTDKFPALSALAREFSKLLEDDYLAGLWKADFLRGLTWYNPHDVAVEPESEKSPDYTAPSWSWASTRAKVAFVAYPDYKPPRSGAEILHVFVEPKGMDVFGKVRKSYLRVRGRSFIAKIRLGDDKVVPGRKAWYVFSQPENEPLGTYLSDYPTWEPGSSDVHQDGQEDDNKRDFELEFLYLRQYRGPKRSSVYVAIALEKCLKEPCQYLRKGLLKSLIAGLSDEIWSVRTCLKVFEIV